MYHYRTNPPSRRVTPAPLFVPTLKHLTRIGQANRRRQPRPDDLEGVHPLLVMITQYLRRTGMAESTFGRRVCGDPALIADIRWGRVPRAALATKIASFISEGGDHA